jgi:hypothetical protein
VRLRRHGRVISKAAISRAKHQVGSLGAFCQQLNGQKRQDRADNERLSTEGHRKNKISRNVSDWDMNDVVDHALDPGF